jgi:hypothetical protein
VCRRSGCVRSGGVVVALLSEQIRVAPPLLLPRAPDPIMRRDGRWPTSRIWASVKPPHRGGGAAAPRLVEATAPPSDHAACSPSTTPPPVDRRCGGSPPPGAPSSAHRLRHRDHRPWVDACGSGRGRPGVAPSRRNDGGVVVMRLRERVGCQPDSAAS